jgi:hypothetical protein
LVEEEEEQEPTDRSYWEDRGTKATVAIADDLLKIIKSLDAAFELKYNRFYIGLAKAGQPNNFAVFRAKKNYLRLEIRLAQSEEVRQQLDKAGLDLMEYDARWERYRIRLTKPEVERNAELLKELLSKAYKNSLGQ